MKTSWSAKRPGEKVDVKVTFPENYHAKDLAGKDAVFAVDIKELRETKNVEINDEFAKSLGEKSLDSLKSAISDRIKGDYEAASRMKLKRALLDNLDKNYNFDVPQGWSMPSTRALSTSMNRPKSTISSTKAKKPSQKKNCWPNIRILRFAA